MKIKDIWRRELLKAIKQQCKWCQSLETWIDCDGTLFFGGVCPLFRFRHLRHSIPDDIPRRPEMLDAIASYCRICQASNSDEDIHPCDISECKLHSLWES